MERRLVFEDTDGKVVRSFNWSGEALQVVRRADTKRLELLKDTAELSKRKVKFENLGSLNLKEVEQRPFFVGQLGHLKLLEEIHSTDKDVHRPEEVRKLERYSYGALVVLGLAFLALVISAPKMTPKIEEALKQQVVKIVKSMEKREIKTLNMNAPQETVKSTATAKKSASLKRMGALAALGSLSKSQQRSGLNLGAANTTAGPGLGGTQGSGGVQTSLYAKGIVGAPLGAGGNIKGAGGYGTKGKGGGQAGYGQLSLVGAAGTSSIPLANEASVDGGLDRDQIAAVIAKNLGQVRFCYEQGLQSDAGLNGRVAVDFTINGQGVVQEASVANTTLHSKTVEDCLLLRLKTWKFPLPQGGVAVKVSYPFMLRRAGQG